MLALGLFLVGLACTHPPEPPAPAVTPPPPPPVAGLTVTASAIDLDGTRKWRFAAFFNRLKRQVAERWHPEDAYRKKDPYGTSYARIKRYTELQIELTGEGDLRSLRLVQSCGLAFLDDEAISAFRGAAPFANPPRQLADADGIIRFRFGFLFDLNGPPQMRWFRYHEANSADGGAEDGKE